MKKVVRIGRGHKVKSMSAQVLGTIPGDGDVESLVEVIQSLIPLELAAVEEALSWEVRRLVGEILRQHGLTLEDLRAIEEAVERSAIAGLKVRVGPARGRPKPKLRNLDSGGAGEGETLPGPDAPCGWSLEGKEERGIPRTPCEEIQQGWAAGVKAFLGEAGRRRVETPHGLLSVAVTAVPVLGLAPFLRTQAGLRPIVRVDGRAVGGLSFRPESLPGSC